MAGKASGDPAEREPLLCGAIDLHVHAAPDVRPRAYDDFELAEAAVRVGARAIVLKSHQGSTVERAYLATRWAHALPGGEGFTMFGGVALNRSVGGINPSAVEAALKLGGKLVWLPTQSARNARARLGLPLDGCVDVVKRGEVVPELRDVLALVARYGAVLCTGHLSPEESFLVARAAVKEGVTKLIVTHPEWWLVGMTLEDQRRISGEYGAFLERCYAQPMGGGRYKVNLQSNLEEVRVLGAENVVISTDGGQIENPRWEIALGRCIRFLLDGGVSEADVLLMTRGTQARLLGLNATSS